MIRLARLMKVNLNYLIKIKYNNNYYNNYNNIRKTWKSKVK